MTDEYLEQRKRYIQEVRDSFSQNDNGYHATYTRLRAGAELERDTEPEDTVGSSSVWKAKILISVMLFAAFVLCDKSNTKFFSMSTETISEKIQMHQKIPPKIEKFIHSFFDSL